MSGRPRTPIGTWGEISTNKTKTGYQARARYRSRTGALKEISATGRTATVARARLRDRLNNYRDSDMRGGINPNATVKELLKYWLDRKDVLPQTKDDYRQTINHHIAPQLGQVRLGELTPGLIAATLDEITPGEQPRARSILNQALALALALDAIPSNPVPGLPKPRRNTTKTVQVFPVKDLVKMRKKVTQWINGEITDSGEKRKTPTTRQKRAVDLLDFIDLLLATGCRPGELAAMQWRNYVPGTPPTLIVNATMVWRKGTGLTRQNHTKTRLNRTLALPPFAVTILERMRETSPYTEPTDPIFTTADGKHRDPGTIRRQWRRARKAAGCDGVELRTMRRTVATVIDRTTGDTAAAAQLGHTSTTMTHKHYIARETIAPDLTAVLQQLAGEDETEQSAE